MIDFHTFKVAVSKQLAFMTENQAKLFEVEIDKDLLWQTYLQSFPEGSNPIFRERTEHDCSCCRQFIKGLGAAVAIKDNTLVSVWDVDVPEPYKTVAAALSQLVKGYKIDNIYTYFQSLCGTDHNHESLEDGGVRRWDHFSFTLPKRFVTRDSRQKAHARSRRDVVERSLKEIVPEAVDTVLNLIVENSLYRGQEHKAALIQFKELQQKHTNLSTDKQDIFYWTCPDAAGIRNTVIGTLLIDLSEGMDVEKAVHSFEAKVAPINYKRPKAVVTQRMIESAKAKVVELGLYESLSRRHCDMSDLNINNLLFKATPGYKEDDAFSLVEKDTTVPASQLERLEGIPIRQFMSEHLPKAERIEILFEARHQGNLASIIGPADMSAPSLFRWPNAFSWAYRGDVADSIATRVKAAGGSVSGVLRCSLAWYNTDDLDLHAYIEVNGRGQSHLYFGNRNIEGGELDVDMNVCSLRTDPVENITWEQQPPAATYHFKVNQFTKRNQENPGFEVELAYQDKTRRFHYTGGVRQGKTIPVVKFTLDKKGKMIIIKSLPEQARVVTDWGITSQRWHNVMAVLPSPNYWDRNVTGNEHVFFLIDECAANEPLRGFFNEFLRPNLEVHRKVFEQLGSKSLVQPAPQQLSGLGFSLTKPDHLYVKVNGRSLKIVF